MLSPVIIGFVYEGLKQLDVSNTSIIVCFVDKNYLENLMLPIFPSPSPCNHQRGLLKISSVANVEQFRSA